MPAPPDLRKRDAQRGISAIELALVLPVLLLLVLGVADFARAILFNNVLINMSREGANLASRTMQSPQFIIDALNHTASPLEMETHGMVYIARVTGVDDGHGAVVARVDEMHRATAGDASLASKVWSCPSWTAGGQCNLPADTADRVVVLPMRLALGAQVHAVEVIYHYAPMSNYVMRTASDLYSWTLL